MSKKLQFQSEKSPSIGPKVAITSWYLFCGAGAVWLNVLRADGVESNRKPWSESDDDHRTAEL